MATAETWNWVVRLASKFGAKNSWVGRVYYGEDELGGETYRLSGEISIRPSTRLQFSATPNYLATSRRASTSRPFTGGGPAATYGSRYVFAQIDQSTFLMQLRANYTIGPDLTLELYGEPFAASGRYYGFGELAAPRTFNLRRYGTSGTTIARDPAATTRSPTTAAPTPSKSRIPISISSRSGAMWCCGGSGGQAARCTSCGPRTSSAISRRPGGGIRRFG